MTITYFRPLLRIDPVAPSSAVMLGGGPHWFSHVEVLQRDQPPSIQPATVVDDTTLARLTALRPPIAGVSLHRPRIMGILNVTPDSFSDGGRNQGPAKALFASRRMVEHGADIIDVGGESTRPGAATVPIEAEIARIEPTIQAIRAMVGAAISIDTRKACVADVAVQAGAQIVNDVSGMTYDPGMAGLCAQSGVAVCVMHSKGDPETMQDNPRYDDVLLDVYDFLAAQVSMLADLGIPQERILLDPGIGFGKTQDHNLALLRRLSLFHSIGCPLLLGASRKKFIGTITGVEAAADRVTGSVAVAQAAAAQGVQVLRVHDVAETRQALAMWEAIHRPDLAQT